MNDLPFDHLDIVETLEAIRRADGRFVSRPDPAFPTHDICLSLEARGVLTRGRETSSGFTEWWLSDTAASRT